MVKVFQSSTATEPESTVNVAVEPEMSGRFTLPDMLLISESNTVMPAKTGEVVVARVAKAHHVESVLRRSLLRKSFVVISILPSP